MGKKNKRHRHGNKSDKSVKKLLARRMIKQSSGLLGSYADLLKRANKIAASEDLTEAEKIDLLRDMQLEAEGLKSRARNIGKV